MFFLKDTEWLEVKSIDRVDNKFYINNEFVTGMTQIKFFCECCNKEVVLKKLYDYTINLCSQCKRKKTNIEKYGVENVSKAEDVKRKIGFKSSVNNRKQEVRDKYRKTMLEKYGVETNLVLDSVRIKKHSEEAKKKISQSNEFINRNDGEEILNKRKKTNKEKYGADWSFQSNEIKSKIKKTNIEKYGESFPTSFSGSMFKQNMIKKYGVENAFQSKSLREKADKTKIEIYGDKNNFEKIKQTKEKRYNDENYNNAKKISDSILKTKYNDFKNFAEFCVPLFDEREYLGSSTYKWKCVRCNKEFESKPKRFGFERPRCPKCDFIKGQSNIENSLYDWLNSLNLVLEKNNRNIISPYELDIYIPSHNLAIEFDGLYWHSEKQIIEKKYHLNKTILCENKEITLIHVFEDEWIHKQDIVKSIILNNLNFTQKKIYGRKTKIVLLKNNEIESFYKKNHIQGFINSSVNIGLFYEDEMVSALSFSKPRFNKKYDWEITRFANKINTSVIGSFAKLLSHFKKIHKGSIITYSDRRFFTGEVYKLNGFNHCHNTSPNYYYTDYITRFNRIEFQKHKLKDKLELFNENISEWENMKLNGYDRIWDCGNSVFIL